MIEAVCDDGRMLIHPLQISFGATVLHTHGPFFCCSNGCFAPLKYISYNSSESSLQLHSQSHLIK